MCLPRGVSSQSGVIRGVTPRVPMMNPGPLATGPPLSSPMWLLPLIPRLASATMRAYYRLTVVGAAVPASGPVLVVANHPNSLLDPAMVATAARRPVRFLAKAPLFDDPLVGWLIRASGSIPVFRAADDPAAMGRNAEMFRAVHAALAGGAAVGIFPEGLSHSDPSIAPLKTGAARMALGAYQLLSGAFPILPVGLVFRAKDRFRSEALVVVGEGVQWADLAPRGQDDAAAVLELTARIDAGLRAVTVNLARWEDAPIVECAESVYAAEITPASDEAHRIERLRMTTEVLGRLRQHDAAEWWPLFCDVSHHARVLRRLRLTPADLHADTSAHTAARWAAMRLPLVGLPVLFFTALGLALLWPPYRLTGLLERIARPRHDVRSTHKVLTAIPLFALWTALLAALAGQRGGPATTAAVLVALPCLALFALAVSERWREAWSDARRFFILTRRGAFVRELRERQRALALRLHAVLEASGTAAVHPTMSPARPTMGIPSGA
jgi:glycerol-3-phosphate O-acyltransferase/dihydroxyacetone phosphate acyltransferase